MRTIILSAILLLTAASCQTARDPKLEVQDEVDTVQHDVRTLNEASLSGDTDTLLRYTFPAIVKKMGGEQAFRTTYANVAITQQRLGIKTESLTFPTPPEFIEGKDGRMFVLVPNTVIVASPGGRAAMSGFMLGVKEAGATEWKYIPGHFVREDTLPGLLPDFPAQHPLPRHSKEKLSS